MPKEIPSHGDIYRAKAEERERLARGLAFMARCVMVSILGLALLLFLAGLLNLAGQIWFYVTR